MNGGWSDASTSTEDMKGRPLCLYYFAHPFGVLSPEPPRVAAFAAAAPPSAAPHHALALARLVRVPAASFGFEFGNFAQASCVNSSLPETVWVCGGGRAGPGGRLPPLRVRRAGGAGPPAAAASAARPPLRGMRSLPPLAGPAAPVAPSAPPPHVAIARSDLLRDLTRRLRLTIKGGREGARRGPRHPRESTTRTRTRTRTRTARPRLPRQLLLRHSPSGGGGEMRARGGSARCVSGSPGASPGLLLRRYSAPEAVMRRYRLAQLQDVEMNRSGEPCSCDLGEAAPLALRPVRSDRELMRRSALLRRMHGRVACCCVCSLTSRSLDTSHAELPARTDSSISGNSSPKQLYADSSVLLPELDLNSPNKMAFSKCSTQEDRSVTLYTDKDTIDSSTSELDVKDISDTYIRCCESSMVTMADIDAVAVSYVPDVCSDDSSTVGSSDIPSSSIRTARKTVHSLAHNDNQITQTCNIDDSISEKMLSIEKVDEIKAYNEIDQIKEKSSYDILEVVVTETLNTFNNPVSKINIAENTPSHQTKISRGKCKRLNDISSENIDEYVSNILVESLNSLTDQLESMNASISASGKLNIVEKEIKVKLQNTGVNTIVHLSPTSNNQIIFGHEELCNSEEVHNGSTAEDMRAGSLSPGIRDELFSAETNNNLTSAESLPAPACASARLGSFTSVTRSENVNKAVLQQIQKLFQDDLQKKELEARYSHENKPSISHIKISNLGVFIGNNDGSFSTTTDASEKHISFKNSEVIGGITAGNYYENLPDNAVVPRFTAFPHTESMEVNTSSSDDVDILGSECTSLVDSLDDPNSPRSVMHRKIGGSNRRNDLVRSSMDILDLLPEDVYKSERAPSKEKGESFFVTIKDDNCKCDSEKKDIVVADHMPDIIKQRLYRRHKKRELRMECARRSKVNQQMRELDKQYQNELRKSKNEMERECKALIDALVNEVIAKIAQDVLKCMRIKQKSVVIVSAKSEESLVQNNWKKDVEHNNNIKKSSKNYSTQSCLGTIDKKYRKDKFQIRGKLSLQSYPPITPNEKNPKKIYQKSEIHDGKKCIEILEILEYANSSASSPEACSDDNQSTKQKKSRIPVPVLEKTSSQKIINNDSCSMAYVNRNSPNMEIINKDQTARSRDLSTENLSLTPPRRVLVPCCERRLRSNSLRYKRVFDIIPEERTSLSVETANEDSHSRRASAPSFADGLPHAYKGTDGLHHVTDDFIDKSEKFHSVLLQTIETRSAGTSPIPHSGPYYSVLPQTDAVPTCTPLQRSAATSPFRNLTTSTQTPLPRRKSILNQYEKTKFEQQSPASRAVRQQERQRERQQEYQRERPPPPGTHRPSPGEGNERRMMKLVRRSDQTWMSERNDDGQGKRYARVGGGSSGAAGGASSSSSCESGGLLCSLAPAWLQTRRRRRRASSQAGRWAVTVAGSCAAALPADVEMRLRFPATGAKGATGATGEPAVVAATRAPRLPPAARPTPRPGRAEACGGRSPGAPARVTLTLKKEASDSSILASKSVKKSTDTLPDVETFQASRSKTKSSVKMRRGCSLHCWLPDDVLSPIRASEGLSVLGAAIVPERKPRRAPPVRCRY